MDGQPRLPQVRSRKARVKPKAQEPLLGVLRKANKTLENCYIIVAEGRKGCYLLNLGEITEPACFIRESPTPSLKKRNQQLSSKAWNSILIPNGYKVAFVVEDRAWTAEAVIQNHMLMYRFAQVTPDGEEQDCSKFMPTPTAAFKDLFSRACPDKKPESHNGKLYLGCHYENIQAFLRQYFGQRKASYADPISSLLTHWIEDTLPSKRSMSLDSETSGESKRTRMDEDSERSANGGRTPETDANYDEDESFDLVMMGMDAPLENLADLSRQDSLLPDIHFHFDNDNLDLYAFDLSPDFTSNSDGTDDDGSSFNGEGDFGALKDPSTRKARESAYIREWKKDVETDPNLKEFDAGNMPPSAHLIGKPGYDNEVFNATEFLWFIQSRVGSKFTTTTAVTDLVMLANDILDGSSNPEKLYTLGEFLFILNRVEARLLEIVIKSNVVGIYNDELESIKNQFDRNVSISSRVESVLKRQSERIDRFFDKSRLDAFVNCPEMCFVPQSGPLPSKSFLEENAVKGFQKLIEYLCRIPSAMVLAKLGKGRN